MSNGSAAYHFLPWVRYGVAAGLKGPPVLGKKAEYETGKDFIPSRAPMPITVRLIGESPDDEGVTVGLRGYGPGDVVGIDPREVVRTEPRHLVTDLPPHLFPFIEFDRPDFPWLFTPAAPDAEGCLRPWIVLVVVRKQDAKLTTDPTKPLPVLRCKVKELPDLEESWAWVHAQYVGDAGETQSEVKAGLSARPQQNVSRLLCPRKLAEHQGGDNGYLACVVPAFKAGVQAGNGDMPDDKLEPAWKMTDDGEIDLPVYYHWEFGTGAKGDFEDLIDGLELRNLPAGSSRLMDASQPGGGMSEYQGMTLGIASALQAPQAPEPLPGNFTSSNFQQDIQKLLEPAQTVSAGAAVPPPIYGGWYVPSATPGRPSLDVGAAPPWLRELNLDPRYRVAAALGTQVVQRQQEQLVAAAWEQAAQLQAVNQWLKQKQLGSVVTASIYEKRLAILSEDTFWQLTAPAGASVNLGAERVQRSAAALLSSTDGVAPQETAPTALQSPLAKAIISAPFRRLARPLGRLSRQAAVPAIQPEVSDAVAPVGAPARQPGGLLERIRTGRLRVAPPPGAPAAASGISDHGSMPGFRLRPAAEPFATPMSLGIPEEQIRLMKKLDPYQTFREEARERIEGPSSERTDSLQPISDVPLRFPQPMYEPLRELFQDMLLPGLDRIRNDSLVELSANPAFIEAYLVGLNHELARELLWREFPTHLDSTYFRQFWDVRGSLSSSASAEERERFLDIPEIRHWKYPLGSNMPAPRGSNLFMLLIKGDLLVRYPNAVISVQRAENGALPKFPILRINPVPGVTLLGFELEPSPLKASPGDPGWFFVFEEHPTETRFGLDISGGVLNSWRELTWDNVKTQDNGYIRVTGSDATPQPSPPDPYAVWGRNGADMAYITLQKAYRLRVHSSVWFRIEAQDETTAAER